MLPPPVGKEKEKVKKIFLLLPLVLAACVTMKYQDGNKSVEYTSIGRTAQTIQGDLNKGTVRVEGQKIDVSKVINAATDFLKAIQ